jgi:copper chaperone NosL
MARSRWLLFAMACIATIGLAGCGSEKEASFDPPDVKYSEDISEMGMFVTDPRFTVAYLPEDGEWILFDDIGEMFRYQVILHSETKPRAIWVNDYLDKDWMRVEDAWFVQSSDINSPMGWGIAAFRDEGAARQLQADSGGVLMSWTDVQNQEWDAPPAPMPQDNHAPEPVSTPTP